MPRFFFDITSPDSPLSDENGVELRNLAEVKSEAIAGARGILAADLRAGRPIDHQKFEVRDESNALVFVLPFRDVFDLPAG